MTTDVVRFATAAGRWAVAIDQTVEVRNVPDLRPLPDALPGVAGVTDRGDTLLTVVNPLGATGSMVLVLDAAGIVFGLLVDHVAGVARVPDAAIGPPPPGQDHGLVTGMFPSDDGPVLLIDAAGVAPPAPAGG